MEWGYIIMEIERIGENKIRCALTEEEIRQLGFDIDEIIGNSETTQQFMRVVLGMVEEQEHISMDSISPMVKAELLQNHSMAITFGAESETSFKSLVDTVNHIMSRLDVENLAELGQLLKSGEINAEEGVAALEKKRALRKKKKAEPMVCALRFPSLEDIRRMCRVCFPEKVPESSLYKMEQYYYLVLDFTGFTKEEMRPFAFGTVEYDDGHYSETAQIACIREQGKCIMKTEAIEMLMQL